MAHTPTRSQVYGRERSLPRSDDVSGQPHTAGAGDCQQPHHKSWGMYPDSTLDMSLPSSSAPSPRSRVQEHTQSRGGFKPCMNSSLLQELAALKSPTFVSFIKPQASQASGCLFDNSTLNSKAPHDHPGLQGKHTLAYYEDSQGAKPQNMQTHLDQANEIAALKQQIKLQSQELMAARLRSQSMLQQLLSSKRTAQRLREEIAELQQHQPNLTTEAEESQTPQMAAIILKLEQCMRYEQQHKEQQQQEVQRQMELLEQRGISEEDQVTQFTQLVLQLQDAAEQHVVFEAQLKQATATLAKP